MGVTYLKKATVAQAAEGADVTGIVADMLARMRAEGEGAALDYAKTLDGWEGDVLVPRETLEAAIDEVPSADRGAIEFAHHNIRRFAEAQRASLTEAEIELRPGLVAGQRVIPVQSAGCYVPGGRYAHVASALMTIATAKAAGVGQITAATPPRDGAIPAAVLYAMHLAGADRVLAMGGVQAIGAMAMGFFGGTPADILVGPGNQFVAEAKRQMFGPLGIDMFAGPTDSMILADASADAETVAWDLIGQAEHGANSPVWLATTHRPLAEAVLAIIPRLYASLPELNAAAARAAWDQLGEVILCDTREDMARIADTYAPEHLQVQASDLEWWLEQLQCYGSLFLGENTTVAFGDKASGTNHVLPTSRAARYTGGLSVHKFLKITTWQTMEPEAIVPVASATARISRLEGMEGHALTADLRIEKLKAARAIAGE
ncbi:histidinol dehydrogenase [Aliishimia ponticola]|uniref:Histidinol dehydrogenase homolog n=1 Tax=Aliishimia ponticola TaxID=2499833 RepID=A0A4S4NA43_9RHOB|nr:histidinol dehydrogenase [Aliishimia ponticola]THH36152.1 histidinol dehydrogenase [Aliishimia ponticola]